MKELYLVAGLSKQAHHKYIKHYHEHQSKLGSLVMEADILRDEHPGCGVEKMYFTLKPDWLGRDKFIELFMSFGYRLKKQVNYRRTTRPGKYYYPNLIKGMLLTGRNQLWQSDLTYIYVENRFYYLVHIIDVYTKRIIGYSITDHMRAEANIAALVMAFKNSPGTKRYLIHHSDKGSQYIALEYLALLNNEEIFISMANIAQENAYAESFNGIIKVEYLNRKHIRDFKHLKKIVKESIHHYNTKRIHGSLPERMTPKQFDKKYVTLTDQKRPKVIIYTDGKDKIRKASSLPDLRPEKEPLAPICPIVNN